MPYLMPFFLLGLILGSFVSVLIYRLYKDEEGIITGRSKCGKCGKVLSALELIPLISWAIQKAKCKKCGKKISMMYPLLELSFGALLAIGYWLLAIGKIDIWTAIILFGALVLFWYDVWFMTVDRRISIPLLFIALLGKTIVDMPNLPLFLWGAIAGALFYAIQHYASKGQWVGAGDIELGTLMGLTLGIKTFWLALFSAYLLGSLCILIYVLTHMLTQNRVPPLRGIKLPMGAFLMPSLMLFLIYGEEIWTWYEGMILFV